ncbi:MAG: hypothetical protein GW941_02180 [Candidatus Pacebacteria bacterium]|nr:hypothetical protein [Candidatus Paceibacterota bacterium]
MKKVSPKIIRAKRNKLDQLLAKLAIFVSILMIAGGAIGMILVQKDLRESQDLRQQASVADGKVIVTMSATDLAPDEAGKINFYINTAGIQTDGVQLTFNVVTDTLPNPPTFSIIDSAPLQLAYSEVETTSDGYLVSIIALPEQLGQPFSSTTALPFATLDLNPNKTGNITLNFDVENSISTVHASNPPTDELKYIATSDFNVSNPTITSECQTDTDCSNSEICYQPPMPACPDGLNCVQVMPAKICQVPEASPVISPSPIVSPSPTAIASPDISPSPSPDPTTILQSTPSPDPTIDPGIGGNQDIATCNESCAVNADCDVNLRCYSGQCRLVTNVSSTTCSNPTDQGLSFSCDEYCSDTNECRGGLVCQNNKCRNPENVNSITCADITVSQRNDITSSCNQSCSTNNDCAANLRCYQGACRLATNPGSYSCSASTKKIVSTSVYGGTSKLKGEENTSDSDTNGKKDSSTNSGSVLIDSEDKDLTDPAGTDKVMVEEDGEETALDSIKLFLLENPKLPITLLGIGIGLIIALLLLALLKRRKDDEEPPKTPTGGIVATNKYEDSLQNKINTLKKESINHPSPGMVPPIMAPVSTTAPKPVMTSESTTSPMPVMTTAPATPKPLMTPPPASGLDRMKIPQNAPISHKSGEVFSSSNRSTSMLDKLKNKNITPPSV